jgi:hypothetical protein
MRIPRNVTTTTASVVLTGTAFLGAVPSASAAGGPVAERYAARAGAQVAEISLLGRTATFGSAVTDSSLEAVGRQLTAAATGTGTDLAPTSRSVARFPDGSAAGGTNCAAPPLGAALDGARSKLKGSGAMLPGVDVAPACGTSSVTGTPAAFTAESTGGRTQISVKLPAALQSLVGQATAYLSPKTLSTPVGDLVGQSTASSAEATKAVGALNGILGSIAPGVALPAMEPRQTVATLLERLESGDLVRFDLASATARNSADPKSFVAEALSDGGVIEVLPGFRGTGSAPLLRLTIARSRAAVPVDRGTTNTAPVVENAVVRIESDLLGTLPVAGPPVVNGLVHGVPLAGLPGAGLPVAGGLPGRGLPLDHLVAGLGLRSGAGYLEVGPGQTVSILCDGPVAALCSEISVGAAQAPVTLPNGATRAESSTVTAHLFKGLDGLVPGTPLGTALAQPAVMQAFSASAPSGMTLGAATAIPGIRLVSGGSVAEAGGARVAGAEAVPTAAPADPASPAATPAPVRDLPHTGGSPFPAFVAPALVGASVALGALARRRRSA